MEFFYNGFLVFAFSLVVSLASAFFIFLKGDI